MEQEIAQLKDQIAELMAWKEQKTKQQILFPLDDASRNTIGGVIPDGAGATTKTLDLNLTGNAETITVPALYTGTILLLIDGVRYEIPYIATS